jgi:hypothetical protein
MKTSRRRRWHSKRDYTKNNVLLWFVIFIIALAAYIIIDTINSKGRDVDPIPPDTDHPGKVKKTEEENFDPRHWN